MERLIHLQLGSNHIDKLNSIFFEIDSNGQKKLEIGQSFFFHESTKVGISFGI